MTCSAMSGTVVRPVDETSTIWQTLKHLGVRMKVLKGESLVARDVGINTCRNAFYAVNPASGRKLEPCYQSATSEQVEAAVCLAHEAAVEYRTIPIQRRARFLNAIAVRIESIVDQLVERVQQETGLTDARIRGETARTAAQLRLFSRMVEEGSWVDARIDPSQPERQPQPRPDVRSLFRPLGPVAIFGASNFPLAFSVAGGDTAAALAAGCPVVVKAHPYHPGVSELVGRAIMAACRDESMPDGVFALLFDATHEVGESLVRHRLIKAVGFTGSFRGGRHLFDLASARDEPIPVFAEMGSVNPIFLLPGALASRGPQIAMGLHQSFTMGTGQFCTKPGLVFTNGNEAFRRELTRLVEQTPAGTMLHAGIREGFSECVSRMRSQPGVTLLAESHHKKPRPASIRAILLETRAKALIENAALLEEMFGPATMLVRYESQDELLAAARKLPGQLTATIHAERNERSEVAELVAILEDRAGRLVFNQFPTGVEVGHAMIHGGPYPATTDSRFTSVGAAAIRRFVRPVCYQNFPDDVLPEEIRIDNPLRIHRLVDGQPG